MAQRIIYLVRHGQYDIESLHKGKDGGGLTKLGKKQAAKVIAPLSKLPISVIHHSDYRRAVETAEIIHAKLTDAPLKSSRLLRECIPYPPLTVIEWMQVIPQADMEVGAKQAVQAVHHFFKPTKGADKHELVVCHGNIIRFFVVCAIGAPMEAWVNMDINHCGITEIRVDQGGGLRLVTHNDVGHLTPDLRTFG